MESERRDDLARIAGDFRDSPIKEILESPQIDAA